MSRIADIDLQGAAGKINLMKKLLAVVLAGLAFSASANGADRITVGPGENCPAGTAATVPSYHWEDGRFVRDGWLCESIYRDSRGG